MIKIIASLIVALLVFVSCSPEQPGYDPVDVPNAEISLISEIRDSDEIMFGSIINIEITNTHHLLAGDFTRNRIHIFDEHGEFIYSAIKDGRGPGEIQRFMDFRVNSENQVMVYDVPLKRFVLFNFTGSDLQYENAFSADYFIRRFHLKEQGEVVVYVSKSLVDDEDTTDRVIKINQSGDVLDNQLLTFLPNDQFTISTHEGMPIMTVSSPHHAANVLDFWGNRFFYARSTETGFKVYDLDTGDEIQQVSLRRPDIPLPQEERREFIDNMILASGVEGLSSSRYLAQMPEIKGKVSAIHYDPKGYIWLQTIGEEKREWLIFSEDGQLSARLDHDFDGNIMSIRFGRIAVLEQDAYDVPMIQVYEYGINL